MGVGITGAVSSGLVIPLLLARSATTAQVVDQGAAPSILAVMGGFALFTILALLALPRGHHPVPAHTQEQQTVDEGIDK